MSIDHASIVSIGSSPSTRRVRTLPSANEAAAKKTKNIETVRVSKRLFGSGLLRIPTLMNPVRRPTIPMVVSRSSGKKARANPVVMIGERLTIIAAAALVVLLFPDEEEGMVSGYHEGPTDTDQDPFISTSGNPTVGSIDRVSKHQNAGYVVSERGKENGREEL